MSLDRFENIDEVLGISPTYGETFLEKDRNLIEPLSGSINAVIDDTIIANLGRTAGILKEMHVYSDDVLLESFYDKPIQNSDSLFYFKPEEDLRSMGFDQGSYNMVYNTMYKFAGNVEQPQLVIKEISSDRTEVKVKIRDKWQDQIGLQQSIITLKEFYDDETLLTPGGNSFVYGIGKEEFLLNCGENQISDISHILFEGTKTKFTPYPQSFFNRLKTIWINVHVSGSTFNRNQDGSADQPLRGSYFAEYYQDLGTPTGRAAFWRLGAPPSTKTLQESPPQLDEKEDLNWYIEQYTEADYTKGFTEPPHNISTNYLGAPFYFWHGLSSFDSGTSGFGLESRISQIDGIVKTLIDNQKNRRQERWERRYIAGLAVATGISAGEEYDPPGSGLGYFAGALGVGGGLTAAGLVGGGATAGTAVGTTFTAAQFATLQASLSVLSATGGGTVVGGGTVAAGASVGIGGATTGAAGGAAVGAGLATAGIAIVVAALIGGGILIGNKETFEGELERTVRAYEEIIGYHQNSLNSLYNGITWRRVVTLGTLNPNSLNAAEFLVNECKRNLIDLDAQWDALKPGKRNAGEGRVLERYMRVHATIALQVGAWLNAWKIILDTASNNGQLLLQPSDSNEGVYVYAPDFPDLNINFINIPANDWTTLLDSYTKGVPYRVINTTSGAQYGFTNLILKLHKPLPDKIEEGRRVGIYGRLQKSYIEKIVAYNQLDEIIPEQFLEPNFNIELDKYGKSDGTDFKAWNDLLDANLSTSQQIINEYFSGSFGNIKLNIDYSNFTNFIHYSSATERIDNFFNKLQIIEGYNTRISVLEQVSGSHALTNISQAITRRDTLIGGFDEFEQWMYNKTTASLYTHFTTTDNPASPYPKISTHPIVFYPTTSSQAESWYAGVYSSASLYDSQNQSALINLIPFALRENTLNEDYVLFINMIGQHFDILWTYTKALTDINKREEHPEDGMSDDLLYDVAKSMGWHLSNGWGDANLWEYLLGTNSSGSRSTTIGGLETKPKEKISSEVWRRVLNNLPYIYKSKGTPRSIKALLSCYGIPETFLKIREYGGPAVVDSPNKYESERFIYKVKTTDSKPIRNPFGTINGSRPNTIEVIGKMPLGDFTIGRLTGGGTDLDFEWNYSGGQARILAKTGSSLVMSSSYMNYKTRRDGAFGIISGSSTTIRAVFKDDFGNILSSLVTQSSAPNSIFGNSTQFIVGDGDGNYSSTASIQEIRYYSSSLSEEIFEEHALNTEAYFSDDNTTDLDNISSYNNLVYRIFPDSGLKTSPTSISSSHPNQFFKTTLGGAPLTASLPNHTSADLVGGVDTQFIKVPSVGALNINNNKVRIESSVLSSSLDVEKTAEVSQYDYAPLDSNLVGLYFSSTDVVNNDIYNSEGYFEVDDWVGDPDDRFNEDYAKLRYRANIYFQKYVNLTAASGSAQKRGTAIGLLLKMLSLYDHSIFQQVKQLIPARSEYVGGVLLEPHILERNKYKRGDKLSHTRMDYQLLLEDNPAVIQSTKNDYLGVIESVVPELQSEKSDYLTEIDVKDFHDGTLYNYEYPILSGSSGLYNTIVQNAYWERAVTSSIMNQRLSPHAKVSEFFYSSSLSASMGKYYSSSYIPYPAVQTDELPLSLSNLKFNGCNSEVINPIDGEPSVEIHAVDPYVVGVAPTHVIAQDTTVTIPTATTYPIAQDPTIIIPTAPTAPTYLTVGYPTNTPTRTEYECYEYIIKGRGTNEIFYTRCDGTPVGFSVSAGSTDTICARRGTIRYYSAGHTPTITEREPCGPVMVI